MAAVEIDLILKGIKTSSILYRNKFVITVEIDLILKGIKTLLFCDKSNL